MTKVSRIFIEPRRLKEIFSSLWESLLLLEGEEDQRQFLQDLLTESELLMVAKRIQIAKMLLKGHDYRTIESYVRIGTPTIARMNHLLKHSDQIKKVVSKLVELEEEVKEEMGNVSLSGRKPLAAAVLQEGVKAGARFIIRKEKESRVKERAKRRV
jgi:TrpR-related protein YerC/YecD